jgi:hypothetical protein
VIDLEKISIPAKSPNFFILGAAKSGTTSMYHYLRQHPEVFMSDVKEPSFFCETFQVIKDYDSYFRLFDKAAQQKVIGEASHVYLTDPKSAGWLKQCFPEARFLVCLRNPAERAFSLYSDMRNHRWESEKTFQKALAMEDLRKESEHFKWNNPQYFHNFLYFHSGLYGEQLQRYLSLFDKSQFLIIRLEDLTKDFEITLSAVFRFLEVDPSFIPKQKVYNKTFNVRSLWLQNLLVRMFPDTPIRQSLMKHTYYKKPSLDPSLKKELMQRYQEDQKLLHSLCGIRYV